MWRSRLARHCDKQVFRFLITRRFYSQIVRGQCKKISNLKFFNLYPLFMLQFWLSLKNPKQPKNTDKIPKKYITISFQFFLIFSSKSSSLSISIGHSKEIRKKNFNNGLIGTSGWSLAIVFLDTPSQFSRKNLTRLFRSTCLPKNFLLVGLHTVAILSAPFPESKTR